jgi:hypothetical protein
LGLVKKASEKNIALSAIKFKETDDERILEATFGENDSVLVYKVIKSLINNPRARQSTANLTTPLDNNGIDCMKFIRDEEISININNKDRVFFNLSKTEDVVENINTRSSVEYLQIISPNFDPEKTLMWEFYIDERKKKVEILDDYFLKQVRNHDYTFGFGDILECEVQKLTVLENNLVKECWSISKVISLKPIKKSQNLF